MADYTDLISRLPINDIARQLGSSPQEVTEAANTAIPALLGGMRENAKDPAGEKSLGKALGDHSGNTLTGGVDISKIDERDGEKIVRHVFGDNTDGVVNQLGGLGVGSTLMTRLLPLLAPLVPSWVANQVSGKNATEGAAAPTAASTGGDTKDDDGFLGGILDKITGRDDDVQPSSGGGLADVLGGLLGSNTSSNKAGGVTDILGGLGGLLGGGRR